MILFVAIVGKQRRWTIASLVFGGQDVLGRAQANVKFETAFEKTNYADTSFGYIWQHEVAKSYELRFTSKTFRNETEESYTVHKKGR